LETAVDRLREKTGLLVPAADSPQISARHLRSIIKARRAREQLFGPDLFADPAWDILLECYLGQLTQQRLSVTSVCDAAAVPATTALRWIQKLEQQGVLCRKEDPLDGRRSWIELTAAATSRLAFYFGANSSQILPV
jgi:DNA-binding MarR family transcriptional regulator